MKKSIYYTVKTISTLLTTAAVAVIIFFGYLLYCNLRNMEVPTLGPFRIFIVLSDSMTPLMRTDDAVIVRSVDTKELNVGDIITLRAFDNNAFITHRIMEKNTAEDGSGYEFTTKGDNNNIADRFTTPEDLVVGRFTLRLPQLGRIITQAGENPLYVAVAVIVVIAIQFLLGQAESSLNPKEKQKEENSTSAPEVFSNEA